MLTPRFFAARLGVSALSSPLPPAPQAEKLSQCLLLAVLLHALLLLWIGTAPGGTAPPGAGVWGRFNVTLTGGIGPENATVSPQDTNKPRQQGPVGKGRQERHGGAVRPAEAPQPLPLSPGAAREGEWASRVPEPGEAAEAQAPASVDANPAPQPALIPPAPTAPAPAQPAPSPAEAPSPPSPQPLPALAELRSMDLAPLPAPTALADVPRSTAVLRAGPSRKDSRASAAVPAPLPLLPKAPALATQTLEPRALPSLPPLLRPLDAIAAPGSAALEAPKPLAELRPAPTTARRLEAPPPRPAALSERLPAMAKSEAAASVPAPTLAPPLALPPARQPAQLGAAEVAKLRPLPELPSQPLAKSPELPEAAALPSTTPPAAQALAQPTPAAASAPAVASAPPSEAVAKREVQPEKTASTASSLLEPGTARARLGAPDAGPRLGRDVATPASAAPERKPLNLSLPRGGELSAQGSRGVLPLMPLPPERKSKLSESLEEAKRADCRKAYGESLGLLAVVPLAVDAVRGGTKGCQW